MQYLQNMDFTTLLVLMVNLIFLIFGSKILKNTNGNTSKLKVKIKRVRYFNISLFSLFSFSSFINQNYFQNIIMTATLLLGIYYFWEWLMSYIKIKYQEEKEINGRTEYIETYQMDLFQSLGSFLTTILTINLIANVWEWNSLWQTGSVLATIAAFLAITHSSWLPDNIEGLMLLHKKEIEPGDLIKIKVNGEDVMGFVGRISLNNVAIYDLIDKHSIYIKNQDLTSSNLHILSKNGSSSKDGILRYIDLKIGYDVSVEKVKEFTEDLLKEVLLETNAINRDKGIKVKVKENGDFAVTYRFFYFANARNMLEAEYSLNMTAKMLTEKKYFNILSLDTPILLNKVN